jgi:DNA-binding PadR family transcriptional regulator
MAKRRKVSNLMALAVLALLIEKPMHPYEIASKMRERGAEQNIQFKWGSLYTVVDNLEKHGFIEATGTDRQGRRPERTVYAITDTGRAELTDWVRELVGIPERQPLRFQAALSVLGVLAPDDAVRQLESRVRRLEADNAGRAAVLARHSQEIPRIFLVESEYELALRRAEAEWVRGLLAEIEDDSLPGVTQWRKYHETGEVPPEFAELAERGREPD